MLYGDKQFSGEVHVLSEGHYPNLASMGCEASFTARSIKAVPTVRDAAHLRDDERLSSDF